MACQVDAAHGGGRQATAMEVIEMTTLVPAQAMAWATDRLAGKRQTGRHGLPPGRPLADMSAVTRPLAVIKEGKLVVREGGIIF